MFLNALSISISILSEEICLCRKAKSLSISESRQQTQSTTLLTTWLGVQSQRKARNRNTQGSKKKRQKRPSHYIGASSQNQKTSKRVSDVSTGGPGKVAKAAQGCDCLHGNREASTSGKKKSPVSKSRDRWMAYLGRVVSCGILS